MGKTSARFLKMCRRFIANVSLFLLDVWGRDENHEVKALNRVPQVAEMLIKIIDLSASYLTNFRMTSINSLPYLSLLYSPIPLISPKASIVVGRDEASRWSVLSESTI